MVETTMENQLPVMFIFLSVSIVEASIGSVAFLDPDILIVPDIFLPPLISSFCIKFEIILLVKLLQFDSYIYHFFPHNFFLVPHFLLKK